MKNWVELGYDDTISIGHCWAYTQEGCSNGINERIKYGHWTVGKQYRKLKDSGEVGSWRCYKNITASRLPLNPIFSSQAPLP